MHLYGYFLTIMPEWLAGLLFAILYAALVGAILVMAATAPADFNYGRY